MLFVLGFRHAYAVMEPPSPLISPFPPSSSSPFLSSVLNVFSISTVFLFLFLLPCATPFCPLACECNEEARHFHFHKSQSSTSHFAKSPINANLLLSGSLGLMCCLTARGTTFHLETRHCSLQFREVKNSSKLKQISSKYCCLNLEYCWLKIDCQR